MLKWTHEQQLLTKVKMDFFITNIIVAYYSVPVALEDRICLCFVETYLLF